MSRDKAYPVKIMKVTGEVLLFLAILMCPQEGLSNVNCHKKAAI